MFSVEERKAAGPMVMINVMKTKDEEAAKRWLSSFPYFYRFIFLDALASLAFKLSVSE